ncbi:hypothetical protein TNCV_4318471 [Trichonephila clavipes]|nr:hypothetical protein TNCV_4318471 [Trichonephila clavipes]
MQHHRQERLQRGINKEPGNTNGKKSSFQMNPGPVYSIKMVTSVFSGIVVNAQWQACIRLRYTGPSPGVMIWGAIGYTSRSIVRTFLDAENVQPFLLPARSPDLSPTENIWSMVAERLACHHG